MRLTEFSYVCKCKYVYLLGYGLLEYWNIYSLLSGAATSCKNDQTVRSKAQTLYPVPIP